MINKMKNKKGFTLVELIIVIAVMAILAAIVVPRMSGITDSFKKKADEKTAMAFARELEVQIQNGDTLTPGPVSDGADKAQSLASGDFYFSVVGNNVYVYVATAALTGTVTDATFTGGTMLYVVRDTGGAIN